MLSEMPLKSAYASASERLDVTASLTHDPLRRLSSCPHAVQAELPAPPQAKHDGSHARQPPLAASGKVPSAQRETHVAPDEAFWRKRGAAVGSHAVQADASLGAEQVKQLP